MGVRIDSEQSTVRSVGFKGMGVRIESEQVLKMVNLTHGFPFRKFSHLQDLKTPHLCKYSSNMDTHSRQAISIPRRLTLPSSLSMYIQHRGLQVTCICFCKVLYLISFLILADKHTFHM